MMSSREGCEESRRRDQHTTFVLICTFAYIIESDRSIIQMSKVARPFSPERQPRRSVTVA